VALRAGAGGEAEDGGSPARERALEAGAALAAEGPGGTAAGAGAGGRACDRGGGRRRRVEHVVARRLGARVAGGVGLLDVEGIGAVGLAGQVVALWAGAGGEGEDGGRSAGERALEAGAALAAGGPGGAAAGAGAGA